MKLIDDLNERFRVKGASFDIGTGGLPRLSIRGRAAEAELYLHGAQLTRWQPHGHGPVLWLSDQAVFKPAAAIRGGIPLCWPWFGPKPGDATAKAHGFARTAEWTVQDVELLPDSSINVVLALTDTDIAAASPAWHSAFHLTLDITIGESLTLALTTKNTGRASFDITEAMHTYLEVGDIRRVSITGLDGVAYVDQLASGARTTQAESDIRFTAETDRIYATESSCQLRDPVLNRRIHVSKAGSGSTVVWNPWIEKTARLADMNANGWERMVCIEAANSNDARVHLAPGQSHTLMTRLDVHVL
jgi:glucose-6-phosphate 1-epimerase